MIDRASSLLIEGSDDPQFCNIYSSFKGMHAPGTGAIVDGPKIDYIQLAKMHVHAAEVEPLD